MTKRLKCSLENETIQINISVSALKSEAHWHPHFWDGRSGSDIPNINVTDAQIFAKEVLNELLAEDEIGDTLVTQMIDEAIKRVVENGCEGVEY